MQDRSQIYSEEEYRYELENRMKNLLWTVSGDYDLDVNLDLDSFRESQYITLYDAVKQGAFARYFSKDEFGMYLVKKLYMGADEPSLAGLAQMCVDQAVLQKITAERKGVSTLRKKAFGDILDRDFDRLARRNDPVARMKIAMLQQGLDGTYTAGKMVREQVEELFSLQNAEDTMDVIRKVDGFYNRLVDPHFEKEHGTLEQVLSVREADLKKLMKMCLIHDMGEAITGDIPAFEKTDKDRKVENKKVEQLTDILPEPVRAEWKSLFEEMEAMETQEARLYKSLDKLEALIQHNEADISTWIPLEYDLQMTYGNEECKFTEYIQRLRDEVRKDSKRKIEESKQKD